MDTETPLPLWEDGPGLIEPPIYIETTSILEIPAKGLFGLHI